MLVRHARTIARQWVNEHAQHIPGFYGAFFHGSINELADDELLPAASDVDVMVVLDAADPADKPGKFRYRDVLLEISYLPREQLQSTELVLSQYNLAPSFRLPGIIADPMGELAKLQVAVSRDFAKSAWVLKRCEDARDKALRYAHALDPDEAIHIQAIKCLFAAGITTHVLLVAGLKNPTVRKRYVVVRDLLADYGTLDFHETLLELLGSVHMNREQIEQHLAPMTDIFDATCQIIQSPFPFASDISAESRPIAIDGSRALIESGYHREAMFWIAVTYSRCMTILALDAPERYPQYITAYCELLSDLGIEASADMQRRCKQITNRLPDVWHVAEAIILANTEIDD